MDWKLLTNLPITCLRDATEKLDWYALRWKIETYFKVLKSGCKAEEAKLRTASRLTNLIAIYCIISWRIFWLCMVSRTDPDAPASAVFTTTEQRILDQIDPKPPPTGGQTASDYLFAVARLGGYLSRRATWSSGEASTGSLISTSGTASRGGFVGNRLFRRTVTDQCMGGGNCRFRHRHRIKTR